MKSYTLKIPKPCHEDWAKMTSNEKGRFCSSCAKTVIDFTKKSSQEIQDYLTKNKGKKVCGHFYRKQLDNIVIQLPEETFYYSLSFQKLFFLSLLFVMGTTLFSCKTDSGKVQKIDKVEVINSIVRTDSVEDIALDGMIAPIIKKDTIIQEKDSIPIIKIMGDLKIEGGIILAENKVYYINSVDEYIRFKEDKKFSEKRAKKIFERKIQIFVRENFKTDITKNIGLHSGKYKIYAQIVIDKKGNVSNIKVRAPHHKLLNHTKEILQKLPQFLPAKKEGEKVSVKYTLPITFKVD